MSDEFWMRPILRVADVAASIEYYCERLGCTKAWAYDDERLIIAQVGRSNVDLILDGGTSLPRPAANSVLSLELHEPKLDALYREFEQRGAKIVAPPFQVSWQKNVRQLVVEDLDDNLLVFWGP